MLVQTFPFASRRLCFDREQLTLFLEFLSGIGRFAKKTYEKASKVYTPFTLRQTKNIFILILKYTRCFLLKNILLVFNFHFRGS